MTTDAAETESVETEDQAPAVEAAPAAPTVESLTARVIELEAAVVALAPATLEA